MEYIESGRFRFKKYTGKERTLKFIIEDKASEMPEQVKLLYRENGAVKKITIGQMNRRANRLAWNLSRIGEKKGSHVAVMFTNCPEILYSYIATSKIGAVFVSTNPHYKGHMLLHNLAHSDSTTLITKYEYLERLPSIKEKLGTLKNVIVYPQAPKEGDPLLNLPFKFYSFEKFVAEGSSENPDTEVLDRDLISIAYTSGTTGDPKGCMQYQAQAYRFSQDSCLLRTRESIFEPGDVLLNLLPLYFAGGMWTTFWVSIYLDLVMATVDFSASRFWKDVHEFKATHCFFLGTACGILLRAPESPYSKNNTLRSFVSNPYTPEAEEFRKRFGIRDISTGYGLNEGHGSFACANPTKSTIGKAVVEQGCVLLINEDGRECRVGEMGEICLRPHRDEPWELFAGYYKDPEETLSTMRNFMLHTGDLAYKDEDGWYIFVDRTKHAIRRGGVNISSVRIERSINTHPAIAESAVVSVPSEISEDDIKAYIVLNERQKLSIEELVRYLEKELPYFMIPRYYQILDAMPKTISEKIEKGKLKGEGLTGSESDIRKLGIKLTKNN